MKPQPSSTLDISERGRAADGSPLSLDRRVYFQLAVFTKCESAESASNALNDASVPHVVYESLHDPAGIGVLTYSEKAGDFIGPVGKVFNAEPFASMLRLPEYTMFGRTYSIGYESNLEETLVTRPVNRVLDPSLPWAVWYPVRRKGAFERLPSEEKRSALMEHGGIGHSFGAAGLAHDIRLACHGLDPNDNDFVVGLVGPELHPLSALVQSMRGTVQTAEYVERMGPFFVGRALHTLSGSHSA